jgi:hypothetical protein
LPENLKGRELRRPGCRREDNTEMNMRFIGYYGVD